MTITQCETVEMLTPNQLLISLEAVKYEIPIRSLIRESNIAYEERLQSKHLINDLLFDIDSESNREGFLYQAIIEGTESELIQIRDEILELVDSINVLEKCFRE